MSNRNYVGIDFNGSPLYVGDVVAVVGENAASKRTHAQMGRIGRVDRYGFQCECGEAPIPWFTLGMSNVALWGRVSA